LDAWEQRACKLGTDLTRLPRKVVGRARRQPAHTADGGDPLDLLVARLAGFERASFTRHDLLQAALDVLPPGTDTPRQLRQRGEQLVAQLLDTQLLIALHADDPLEPPAGFHRDDGSSVFTRHARHRWALPATLDHEAWLLKVAREPCGHRIDTNVLAQAATAHRRGPDQAVVPRPSVESRRRRPPRRRDTELSVVPTLIRRSRRVRYESGVRRRINASSSGIARTTTPGG
jgi:hypothetical protein